MTLTFMSLLSATVVERVCAKCGLRLLVPLLIIGVASVVYWRWSAFRGTENLLPYAAVLRSDCSSSCHWVTALLPSRYTRGSDIHGVQALYAAAKLVEVLDAQIYALGHYVSGHTLKHLIAPPVMYWPSVDAALAPR